MMPVVPAVMVPAVMVPAVMMTTVMRGGSRRWRHRGDQGCAGRSDCRQLGDAPHPGRRFHASWIGTQEAPRSAIAD
jgi:hypothetical protein